MNEKSLADMAVKATNVIKGYLNMDSRELMVKILDAVPIPDANFGIVMFTDMAKEFGWKYNEVYDILDRAKLEIKTAVGALDRGGFLHKIATALYVVAMALSQFLPPPYNVASKAVIAGYEALYGGEK